MAYSPEGVLKAYNKLYLETQSGREVEAAALTKAAIDLKRCRDQWHTDVRHANLYKALKYNQRIWSILQGELAKATNPLPRTLREKILNLSLFIDKRIIEILADPSPDKLSIVIDINLNIAAGLRNSVPKKRR